MGGRPDPGAGRRDAGRSVDALPAGARLGRRRHAHRARRRAADRRRRIDAVRGCVAIERGPLVYAVEQVDQPVGVAVDDVRIELPGDPVAEHRPELLGGVTVVTVSGRARRHEPGPWPYRPATAESDGPGDPVPLTAVPYFAWANRELGPMRVWLPRA